MTQGARFRRWVVLTAVPALLIGAVLILTLAVIPKRKTQKAMELLAAGEFETAYALLEELGRDDIAADSRTRRAEALLEAEEYASAYALLKEAGKEELIAASLNERADALLEKGEPDAAYALLAGLTDEAGREKRMAIKRQQIAELKVGRSFTFGLYEQDNSQKNGPEPIRWVILDRDGDRVLVISRYVLDCKLYHEERQPVTWETCTLRAWLNGEFLNAAFDPDELELIQTTHVTADRNPIYDVDPGSDVDDKLFLLSLYEAELYFLPDMTGIAKWRVYEQNYPELLCEPTAYSAARGCAPQSENGSARWWLRTPGLSESSAAWVTRTGGLKDQGSLVNCENNSVTPGIRPAMWIDLGIGSEKEEAVP